MMRAYYEAYPPTHQYNSRETQEPPRAKEDDTEQVAASFLLSLKHSRSVTPEPHLDDSDHHPRKTPYQSYSPYNRSYGYESSPYMERNQQSSAGEQSPIPSTMTAQSSAQANSAPDVDNLSYESLIAGSDLVQLKDRDLVPDALFVAMAQMQPCRLTHADRVGCYKNRTIGFLGMSCKHCAGQPGFGRYYPNSVRSLAQTTTSQTILKHIGNKCRFCPPHIRNAVLQLQKQNAVCEGMTTGRPRYGSRKIFFQRVWSRLHGGAHGASMLEEGGKSGLADDLSTQTPTDVEESSEDEVAALPPMPKRKGRFGALPMQKNKRIKTTTV